MIFCESKDIKMNLSRRDQKSDGDFLMRARNLANSIAALASYPNMIVFSIEMSLI